MAYFLPIYLLAFTLWLLWLSLSVWKKSKRSPIALARSAPRQVLLGRIFSLCILAVILLVFIHTFFPRLTIYLVPIPYLAILTLRLGGAALMILALAWCMIAQYQMGPSWRIGVDQENKTNLVRKGLFHYSRNPIYVGMLGILTGLFLFLPCGLSLGVLITAFITIPIQVRLEEDHLRKLHGHRYMEYCHKTRRWV